MKYLIKVSKTNLLFWIPGNRGLDIGSIKIGDLIILTGKNSRSITIVVGKISIKEQLIEGEILTPSNFPAISRTHRVSEFKACA